MGLRSFGIALILLWVCAPAVFGNFGRFGDFDVARLLNFGSVLVARANLSATQAATDGSISVVILWVQVPFWDHNLDFFSVNDFKNARLSTQNDWVVE